ncbi:MAG: hypothetical protein NZL87_10665 [Thermomicrobium sp.]|nr:hypothetical protein [Thermomicrobium sp.]
MPRRRRAWLTLTLVLAGALAGLCLLYLEQTSRVVELGYELTRLQRQRDAVALEAAALRYELAQRQSLAQVYELATREYGMVPLRRVESLEVARPVETPAAMPDTPVRPTWWQRLRDSVLGVGYAVADEAP